MKNIKKRITDDLLREAVRGILQNIILEKGKGKPGGGLTDLGAMKRLEPLKWLATVRQAISTTDGDIDNAADSLEVSPRTVYAAIEDNSSLQSAKDQAEKEEDK